MGQKLAWHTNFIRLLQVKGSRDCRLPKTDANIQTDCDYIDNCLLFKLLQKLAGIEGVVIKHKIQLANPISNSSRVAKNSILLYIRMFVTMGVSLYTSRVILEALGIENYGIYTIVGGVVSMIGFLNGSMSSASSRFIAYELGNNNPVKLRKTFSASMYVHIIIAVIVLIICETAGLWFVNSKLSIPSDSYYAANWVFQFSVLGALISITQVPYSAVIIAHEQFKVYAYVEMLNVILKLLIVYLVIVCDFDKLIFYSFLIFLINTIIALFYRVYCISHYPESRIERKIDMNVVKPMLSFSGWDLFGSMSVMLRSQGVNILYNIFYGPIANAAMGITTQIYGVINNFSNNIIMAARPQIVKNYASGNYDYMISLTFSAARMMFAMVMVVSAPLIIMTPFILNLWLKDVPEYTTNFCRLTIIFMLYANISLVINAGNHASGRIKRPSFINGSLYLLVVPMTYVAFKLHSNVYFPLIVNILFVIIGGTINAFSVRKAVPCMSIKNYLLRLIAPCTIALCLTLLITAYSTDFFQKEIVRFLVSIVTGCGCGILSSYFIIFTSKERNFIHRIIKEKLKIGSGPC